MSEKIEILNSLRVARDQGKLSEDDFKAEKLKQLGSDGVWYYNGTGGSDEDLTSIEVAEIIEGAPSAEHYVWRDGMADWESPFSQPQIQEALDALRAPEPEPELEPEPEPEPVAKIKLPAAQKKAKINPAEAKTLIDFDLGAVTGEGSAQQASPQVSVSKTSETEVGEPGLMRQLQSEVSEILGMISRLKTRQNELENELKEAKKDWQADQGLSAEVQQIKTQLADLSEKVLSGSVPASVSNSYSPPASPEPESGPPSASSPPAPGDTVAPESSSPSSPSSFFGTDEPEEVSSTPSVDSSRQMMAQVLKFGPVLIVLLIFIGYRFIGSGQSGGEEAQSTEESASGSAIPKELRGTWWHADLMKDNSCRDAQKHVLITASAIKFYDDSCTNEEVISNVKVTLADDIYTLSSGDYDSVYTYDCSGSTIEKNGKDFMLSLSCKMKDTERLEKESFSFRFLRENQYGHFAGDYKPTYKTDIPENLQGEYIFDGANPKDKCVGATMVISKNEINISGGKSRCDKDTLYVESLEEVGQKYKLSYVYKAWVFDSPETPWVRDELVVEMTGDKLSTTGGGDHHHNGVYKKK